MEIDGVTPADVFAPERISPYSARLHCVAQHRQGIVGRMLHSADFSDRRDVVFVPNLVDSPTFGKVHEDFTRRRNRKTLKSWTCKKTAQPGDLYLFYFSQPVAKIAGMAVCSEPPDPKGWKERNWSNRRKMFFCSFEKLHHFDSPVAAEDMQANPMVGSWWKTKPYRGRPKTIPPEAASILLQMIVTREPKTALLLQEYVSECGITKITHRQIAQADAQEGTISERLACQRVRSQALRAAKIRETLSKNEGRLACEVLGCGFDFLETYGELGRGFAHVHHRQSLAKRKTSRTTLADLAIVCANCHAMVHRRHDCRTLQGLIVRG